MHVPQIQTTAFGNMWHGSDVRSQNIAQRTSVEPLSNRKTIRRPSDDHPRIKSSSRTRRFGDLTRPISETILYWKIQHFVRAPAISQNVTKCCACHEKSHSNFSKYCACHAKWISWHLFALGIYSLLASIPSWHPFSLGIYSLLASILSWHLFSLGIYSPLASILSWHLFPLGIYSLLASILSWHLFSLGIYSLGIYSLGIYSLLASIL